MLFADWLATSKTILLPKNDLTHEVKNYRPIACQNIMYKIYTGIINNFLEEHCSINGIITLEQTGKKFSWGCADKLLIKETILEQVRNNRINLLMMWFDYKKAFDSVPHDWIIKALQLAKVPSKIINAISKLMKVWATKIILRAENETIETPIINYLTGVLQGDCLSLLLFILSVNPLSLLLKNLPGYKIGQLGKRDISISYLFFVHDLKTYASDKKSAKLQLHLILQFVRDIGMQLGSDKCAHRNIERGNQKSLGKFLTLDETKLAELTEGECYKYLGQDESIGYNDVLNKERVIKEYMKRIRKIWSSELYPNSKVIAYNTFAIPVLTPTFGIAKWTKDKLEQLDVKTRKILSCNGSFHFNSDIDRLYTKRDKGGRGLNSIADVYIARIISISRHLIEKSPTNKYLNLVLNHEQPTLVRPANELLKAFNICSNDTHSKNQTKKNNHHEC